MTNYYYRDGSPFTGNEDEIQLGKTGVSGTITTYSACTRCGGSGIYSTYHGVCYRCGGHRFEQNNTRVFTKARLDQLNAQAERKATKAAEVQRVRLQESIKEVEAILPGFNAARIQASLMVSNGLPNEIREHANERTQDYLKSRLYKLSSLLDSAFWTEARGTYLLSLVSDVSAKLAEVTDRTVSEEAARADHTQWPEEGRRVVTGTIVGFKEQVSHFGLVHKMILKAGVHTYYGTVPASLEGTLEFLKGKEVSLTATVERSPKDPLFAFLKRPTKAQIIEAAA